MQLIKNVFYLNLDHYYEILVHHSEFHNNSLIGFLYLLRFILTPSNQMYPAPRLNSLRTDVSFQMF